MTFDFSVVNENMIRSVSSVSCEQDAVLTLAGVWGQQIFFYDQFVDIVHL